MAYQRYRSQIAILLFMVSFGVVAANDTVTDKSYRFSFSHSFLWRAEVTVKILDDETGLVSYKRDHPPSEGQRRLSFAEASEFMREFERLAFWKMPRTLGLSGVRDGDGWTVEARVGDKAHIVHRQWTPTDGDWALGQLFLRMSGVHLLAAEK